MKKFLLPLFVVLLVFSCTVCASAYDENFDMSTVPEFDLVVDTEKYPYAILRGGATPRYIDVFSGAPYFETNSSGTVVFKFDNSNGVGYQTYMYDEDDGWYLSVTSEKTLSVSLDMVIASSVDIYHTDGTLLVPSDTTGFFLPSPTLPVIIQGVTGEALEMEVPTMVGTMKILMVCGVGCLALLIILKLFGKRSLIYRG